MLIDLKRFFNAALSPGILQRDVKYQLNLKRERLLRLYVNWERTIVGVPLGNNLPDWGPSDEDIMRVRTEMLFGGGVELNDDGYDVDFEEDADQLLGEHLDSVRISENYREMESRSSD